VNEFEKDPARVLQYVRRAVARSCPARLAHQTEDIVQAVVLKVLEVQQQRTIRSMSYFARAAHSLLVDEIRRQRQRPETSLDVMGIDSLEQSAASHSQPSDELHELGKSIRECLKSLKEPRRMAVVLHLQGFTAEEIQHLLDSNLKKVRNLTYRGMAELRERLVAMGVRYGESEGRNGSTVQVPVPARTFLRPPREHRFHPRREAA
jgi:RNA polymerase sigma-70 factor, ECF subfamily